MYVSLSAGIRNSRSLWSTDAMGLYFAPVISMTVDYMGSGPNISNSQLTDTIFADMAPGK